MILVLKKLWELLQPSQRRAMVLLLILMLLGMVLETLGVGLIIPALAMMTDERMIHSPVLKGFLGHVETASQEQLVIAGLLVLVGINGVRTAFLAYLAWRQARFVFGLQSSLSRELFSGYLQQPYVFHLQRNSAKLLTIVTTEISLFSQGGVNSALLIGTESLIVAGIATLLFIVQPLGALLVTSTLIVACWLFYRTTKHRLVRWGAARQEHESRRTQHLQQGLGGVKDAKLLGRENDLVLAYEVHNEGVARMGCRVLTLQTLPRLWLEFLVVIGVTALVATMIGLGKPVDSLVPVLGVFAAAAFRLMTSLNRILQNLQNLRYYIPLIGVLHEEITLVRKATVVEPASPGGVCTVSTDWRSIILRNVSYQYPGAAGFALDGVNLRIVRGASVGFVGESGAGKSTLIDVILGLLKPSSGAVTLDEADVHMALRKWQDQIGYVPQSIYLTDDTLRRNIAFGLPEDQIDESAVDRALQAAQLTEFVDQLPLGVDTIVGERGVRLSGGQRQRIGIARALYHDPSVLVLDEATSALDSETEKYVMQAVGALHGRKTILIIAHRLSTVAECDQLYRLDRGKVFLEKNIGKHQGSGLI